MKKVLIQMVIFMAGVQLLPCDIRLFDNETNDDVVYTRAQMFDLLTVDCTYFRIKNASVIK